MSNIPSVVAFLGEQAEFLKSNMEVKLMFFGTEALDVELRHRLTCSS